MAEQLVSFLNRQLKVNTAADAQEIVNKINDSPVIEAFELRGNTVGLEGGQAIADALEYHPELKRALWSDMFTGKLKTEIPPILKSLCKAMMNAGVSLVELDLSDNAFGPIGADGIQEFLRSASAFSLQHLKLNNTGLGAGGEVIAQCLIDCHKSALEAGQKFELKTFVAGRNRLENPRAIALARAFKTLGTLEEIDMHQDGINPDGIVAIAESLPYNKNLRVLNLADNTFTAVGALSIAKALKNLNNLEVINFSDCLCRDKGSKAIIQALSATTHPNLREIKLDGCEITGKGGEALIGMMYERLPNTKLVMSTNCFGHWLDNLGEMAEDHGNIFVGDSDDDEGSIESEVEEGSEANDGDGDDEEDDVATAFNYLNSEDAIRKMLDTANKGQLYHLLIHEQSWKNLLRILNCEMHTQRNPVLSSRVVAKLADNFGASGAKYLADFAGEVLEMALKSKKRPLSAYQQILNNLHAFAGTAPLEKGTESQPVTKSHVQKLFNELLQEAVISQNEMISFSS